MNELLIILKLLLFSFIIFHPLNAQRTGVAESTEIILYEYPEPFFDIPVYLDTIKAEKNFRFTQKTDKTRCIYFNYGPFRCHFYSEPGKEYFVHLPDISQDYADYRKDHYFKHLPYHVHVEIKDQVMNETELNRAIREFDKEYEPFLSKQTLRYFQPEYALAQLDSFVIANYESDNTCDSGYFYQYKKYKKGILYYHINQQNLDSLIVEFLIGRPTRFEVPSYRNFFSLILGNYFDYLRQKDQFGSIYSEFTRLSADYLRDYLIQDPLLKNDTILELVLLKECYDAFYSDRMNKNRLIAFTDTIISKTEIDIINLTAKELKHKFTHLMPGYEAPTWSAIDVNGDSVILKANSEHLIYIGFCDINSRQCLKEIEYLKYLSRKHSKFIKIITILKSTSPDQLRELMNPKDKNWNIISWTENDYIPDLYSVNAVPVFFLIDKNGKMLRNPATNPSENFEYELFQILRSKGEI